MTAMPTFMARGAMNIIKYFNFTHIIYHQLFTIYTNIYVIYVISGISSSFHSTRFYSNHGDTGELANKKNN